VHFHFVDFAFEIEIGIVGTKKMNFAFVFIVISYKLRLNYK